MKTKKRNTKPRCEAAAEPSATAQIKTMQTVLFPTDPDEWDGVWGDRCKAALAAVLKRQKEEEKTMNEGKGSWYSQFKGEHKWVDKGDGRWNKDKTIYLGPNNALGVPDDQQGIALYSRKTLGDWFLVTAPNGVTLKLQQTDVGPHPNTGRKIDIAAVAGERFGYTPKNFPTDKVFKWRPA